MANTVHTPAYLKLDWKILHTSQALWSFKTIMMVRFSFVDQAAWMRCLFYIENTHIIVYFFFFFFPFLMLYKEVRELRQFRSDIRLWWRWYKAVDSILANSQRTMHKGIGSTWSWSQLPSWTACRVFATLILLNVIVSAFLSLIHVNPFTRKQLQ